MLAHIRSQYPEDYATVADFPCDTLVSLYPEVLQFGSGARKIAEVTETFRANVGRADFQHATAYQNLSAVTNDAIRSGVYTRKEKAFGVDTEYMTAITAWVKNRKATVTDTTKVHEVMNTDLIVTICMTRLIVEHFTDPVAALTRFGLAGLLPVYEAWVEYTKV